MRRALTLSDAERAAVDEFLVRARAALGNELKEVRLFGPRARGEGHDESDLDIALIVGPEGRAQRRAIYDLAFDVGLAHGIEIAPLVIEETRLQELRERDRQLARDLDTQGIPL
jgi:predicted nucleotidyltransferase